LIAIVARALLIETVSQARRLVVRRECFESQTPMANPLPSDADLVSGGCHKPKQIPARQLPVPHVTQRENPNHAIART
jgi:hypothetical protein